MSTAPTAILCMTGSELTRGETRDLNGSFLAANLTVAGIRVREILLVPDDPELLAASFRRAIEAAELVVSSGGLGPTQDDYTVEVLGRVLGRRVVRDPDAQLAMRARARKRGLSDDRIPPNYWKQSEVLEGAEVLLNPVGLAPGMILPGPKGIVAVLPGVPREMQEMFRSLALPAILSRLEVTPPRILRGKVMGLGESWVEARIQGLGIDFRRVEYGISAKPGEILVKFVAHDPADRDYVDLVRGLLEREFGRDFIPLAEGLVDAGGMPVAADHAGIVHAALLAAGTTVATAESCTGGLIAKMLTDHAGSSAYFVGSVVAYENRVKTTALGVPAALIEAHGAVSAEVCGAMARGVRERLGADWGISTTGIAGPSGGTPEKPVGLVYLGLAGPGLPDGVAVEKTSLWGNRENVRQLAAVRALEMLRRSVAGSR